MHGTVCVVSHHCRRARTKNRLRDREALTLALVQAGMLAYSMLPHKSDRYSFDDELHHSDSDSGCHKISPQIWEM